VICCCWRVAGTAINVDTACTACTACAAAAACPACAAAVAGGALCSRGVDGDDVCVWGELCRDLAGVNPEMEAFWREGEERGRWRGSVCCSVLDAGVDGARAAVDAAVCAAAGRVFWEPVLGIAPAQRLS